MKYMAKGKKFSWKRIMGVCLTAAMLFMMTACKGSGKSDVNLAISKEENDRIVNMYSPMEKVDPNAENVARSASEKTLRMAEEKLGVTVQYITFL